MAVTLADLTPREREVGRLLHKGMSNKVIAHELGIAESTVKVRLRRLFWKLKVPNRTKAALWFDEHGECARQSADVSCDELPDVTCLTPQERNVCAQVVLGLSNKVTAHKLGISEPTVKLHLVKILSKLPFTNRTQLAIWYKIHLEREQFLETYY